MAAKKNAAAPTPAPASAPTASIAAPAVEKAVKELDPNAVPLADICKELGITGPVARRKLRASKVTKDGRWVWQKGSKELEQVKAILSAKPEPKAEAAPAVKQ
jgi:hypothetical protein